MKNSKWLALLLVFVLVSALMPSALAADYVEPFTDVPVKQYYAERSRARGMRTPCSGP